MNPKCYPIFCGFLNYFTWSRLDLIFSSSSTLVGEGDRSILSGEERHGGETHFSFEEGTTNLSLYRQGLKFKATSHDKKIVNFHP